ncbi:hypothetical protein OE766_14955 [Pararhizobium sp. YC-54]|uniref:pectate lyase family protein n=1 Tax=Pararhizobium sp. YC-54 TaxID=2986920 RepID=UPI0021F76201|nr:hypothetical protein [Pararhizobium sp. YC-54]MCV9999541.1 hypothetical protein [Pararhizobium sp. YC-54]
MATGTAVKSQERQDAFPGAEGYGRTAQGGRGGAIIEVTNLKDAGTGSLRACVDAKGPRNCIFRVSGVIRLKSSLVVQSESSFLSILGQTAPGGGIVLTIEEPNTKKWNTPLIVKSTHDVVIRHLKIRPQLPNSVENVDALTVEGSDRVYVDHVSGSWATDENINAHADTTDLTIANSIFAEGLNKHSKCTLLGSDPHGPQSITFLRNLCLSNRDRNPDNNHYGGSCIEIINNVFFNAKSEWGEVFSQFPGGTPISYVGNYFKAGPSTEETTYAIHSKEIDKAADPQIYQADNMSWAPRSKSIVMVAPETQPYIVSKPPCPLSVKEIISAPAAYEEIRNHAGAFPRDKLDSDWIADLGLDGQAGRGRMVNKSGELPPVEQGTAYVDKDHDGIADSIEAELSAKVGVNDAWSMKEEGEWSHFDEFMQWLSEERIAGRYPQ